LNTLLNEIKQFVNTKELTSVNIYNAVENVCEKFKDDKYEYNLLLLDEATDTFLVDKLIDDDGFKYIANKCENDQEVFKTMYFLLNQHYFSLINDKNPHINKLKKDIDYIFTQLPSLFITETSNKPFYKNRFIKSGKFDIKHIENFQFSKYEKINNRFKQICLIIWEHLSTNVYTNYSEILQNVKNKLGISENVDCDLYEDEGNFDNIDLENEKINNSILNELENFNYKDEHDFKESNEKITEEIAEEFLKLLTGRQIQILIFIIKEKIKNNNISIFQIYKSFTDKFTIGKQTFYNELTVIQNKSNLIFDKYCLDDNDKLSFLRYLIVLVKEAEE